MLGLKYILHKKGIWHIDTLVAKCRDGGSIELTPKEYSYLINGHASGTIDRINCGSGILSICGFDLTVKLLAEFSWLTIHWCCRALKMGIVNGRVRREGDIWIVDGTKFKELRLAIVEAFLANHWPLEELDLRGREILDIGAYVGDTALYFLARGARKVVAVEPHPIAYREMVENIELNSAKDKIIPINTAVGSSRGYTKIPMDIAFPEIIGMDALRSKASSDNYVEVPIVTLRDLMDYLEDPYVIKLDCEGCEWEILRKDADLLRKFQVILIEYHGGSYKDIVDRLKGTHVCRDHYYEPFSKQSEYGVLVCKGL